VSAFAFRKIPDLDGENGKVLIELFQKFTVSKGRAFGQDF